MTFWGVEDIEAGEFLNMAGLPTWGEGTEPALFESEREAQDWAMEILGDEAGKYVIVRPA